jgi:Ca2+-binding RTX toxin-like protein
VGRLTALLVAMLLMVPWALPAAAADPPPTCYGLTATIFGQSGNIFGTPGNDVIVGSDGADTIRAGAGDDVVCAGEGDDVVKGGDGDDLIFGEQGSDTLSGERGDDTIFGDADDGSVVSNPTIYALWDGYGTAFGGCATDQPGFGDDLMTGSSGNDTLLDLCGNNTADGGSGADRVDASGTAKGGSGNDVIVWAYDGLYDGGSHAGYADGGSGNDGYVDGVSVNDGYVYVHGGVAKGGSGNDAVFAEHTGSVAEGGSGRDYVGDYSDSYADIGQPFFHDASGVVTLNGGSAYDTCNTAGDDTLISCENVV